MPRTFEGARRGAVPATSRTSAGVVTDTVALARLVEPNILLSLADPDPALPDHVAAGSALARAWRAYERALDQRVTDAALAVTQDPSDAVSSARSSISATTSASRS